jgi:hypothetical protein
LKTGGDILIVFRFIAQEVLRDRAGTWRVSSAFIPMYLVILNCTAISWVAGSLRLIKISTSLVEQLQKIPEAPQQAAIGFRRN